MTAWYVVQTHFRLEDRVAFHLRNQKFRVFLPKYVKTRRHARRTDTVARPLFPGYLFVELDPNLQQWRSINGTVGVSRIVCSGSEPTPVPCGIVEEIIARADDDGIVTLKPQRLKIGQPVRITTGAFAECVGFFQEMVDENRIILLLNMLGRDVRARVSIDALDVAV